MNLSHSRLQSILDRAADQKKIFGTSFSIRVGNEQWNGASGDLLSDHSFFIASTTKLFVTACIMGLRSEGGLRLSDPISRHLEEDVWQKLHIYRGKEYSRELTIAHLLSHTSGLPDYFQQKLSGGKSLLEELHAGNDQRWTFDKVINLTRQMKPHFPPGLPGKAYYSYANFQHLGKVIEHISGGSPETIFEEHIFYPLRFRNTYLYSDVSDQRPATMYFRQQQSIFPGPEHHLDQTVGLFQRPMICFFLRRPSFRENFFPGNIWQKCSIRITFSSRYNQVWVFIASDCLGFLIHFGACQN